MSKDILLLVRHLRYRHYPIFTLLIHCCRVSFLCRVWDSTLYFKCAKKIWIPQFETGTKRSLAGVCIVFILVCWWWCACVYFTSVTLVFHVLYLDSLHRKTCAAVSTALMWSNEGSLTTTLIHQPVRFIIPQNCL